MLSKTMLNKRISRKQIHSHLKPQVILPGFTSLRSQKFHPYLNGLNIDHLALDFSHSLAGAYIAWKKIKDNLISKRALIGATLVAATLLGTGSTQEYRKAVSVHGTILSSQENVFQMTVNIIQDAVPDFQWPLLGGLSTNYSRWHQGVDIPKAKGTPIRPIADGRVTQVENGRFGYGKTVVVEHNSGYASRYAHMSKIDVKVGDQVTTDTTLGGVGNTGRATGNHLHMEIYEDGRTLNPVNLLPAQNSVITANK